MRNLILVSQTPIVIQIFNLVCRKLSIAIEVLNEPQIDHKVDIIVVDKEFIDEKFTILKTYAKQIGAITNEELSFDMANDFTIPSPFLPSNLETILQEQLSILIQKQNAKTYVTNIPQEPIEDENITEIELDDIEDDLGLDEELEPAIDYLDSIADNIVTDFNDESDDSIVTAVSLQNSGGVLDMDELSKIGEMVDLGGNPSLNKIQDSIMEDVEDDENAEDWKDLSDIIDEAIYEVNSTEQLSGMDPTAVPIRLRLNDFSLDELKPLLSMLDQDIIDSLTDGKEIMLNLRLESEHD